MPPPRSRRPRRYGLPRGAADAPPGRSPPRPRPRDRPARLGPGAGKCGTAWRRSQRAVDRLYEGVTVDIAGDQRRGRVERQDLDEMIGNLVENAAKYGGGRVFVTVERQQGFVDIAVEDDGPGDPRRRARRDFRRQPPTIPAGSGAPRRITRSWLFPRTYTSNMPITSKFVIGPACAK